MSELSSELEKVNYVIYRSFDFSYSKKQLTNIYGPIVGAQAILLFQWFIDEFEIQESLRGIASPLKRIFQTTNIKSNEFEEIRERLEAINLISTYFEETNNKRVFHIEIKEPLNWNSFISNEKLRHLLIDKIGVSEYERMSLVYAGRRMPSNVLNISATFNTIYANKKIDEIMSFNFDKLHSYLNYELNEAVIFDNNSRLIIETYFKTHNLSLNEIKFCVNNSIVKDEKNNYLKVDFRKLSEQFKLFINSTPNIKPFDYVKINRDIGLFSGDISSEKFELIMTDYRNINSEQYLSSIQKSPLSTKQKNLINQLRNMSHLSDEIINMITDFTLYKTKGKYNENYLKKIADTINCLSLSTLEEIYNHLSNAYTASTKTIEIFDDSTDNFPVSNKVKNEPSLGTKAKNDSSLETKNSFEKISVSNLNQDLNLDEMFKI